MRLALATLTALLALASAWMCAAWWSVQPWPWHVAGIALTLLLMTAAWRLATHRRARFSAMDGLACALALAAVAALPIGMLLQVGAQPKAFTTTILPTAVSGTPPTPPEGGAGGPRGLEYALAPPQIRHPLPDGDRAPVSAPPAALGVAAGATHAADFYNVQLDPVLPAELTSSAGRAGLVDGRKTTVEFFIAPHAEPGNLVPGAKAAVNPRLVQAGAQTLSITLTCDFCAGDQVQQRGLAYTPGARTPTLPFQIAPRLDRTRNVEGNGSLVFYVKGRGGVLYDNVVVPVEVVQLAKRAGEGEGITLGIRSGAAAGVTQAAAGRRPVDLTVYVGTRNDLITVGLAAGNPALARLFRGREQDCPAAHPGCGTMREFDTGKRLDAMRVDTAQHYQQIGALVDHSTSQLDLTSAQEDALLAQLRAAGQTLYRDLFATGDLAAMITAFEAWAPTAGHRVVVGVVSAGFTAPWQFLYPPGPGVNADINKFWGFRYDVISGLLDRATPGAQAAALVYNGTPVIEGSFQPGGDSELAADNQTYLAAFARDGFKMQPITGSGAAFLQALASERAKLDLAAVFTHAASSLAGGDTGPELFFGPNDTVTVEQLQNLANQVQVNELYFPRQPVVLLNGCWTGTGGALVSGENSFPEEFLDLGARAVVAAETPVWKQFTAEFGSALISQFRGPVQPLSRELLNARLAMLAQHHDPLGLVFSYYGGADVSVTLPSTGRP
ncbi:MAG: CHAT domain-containing protein [Terriglobales bacterium]